MFQYFYIDHSFPTQRNITQRFFCFVSKILRDVLFLIKRRGLFKASWPRWLRQRFISNVPFMTRVPIRVQLGCRCPKVHDTLGIQPTKLRVFSGGLLEYRSLKCVGETKLLAEVNRELSKLSLWLDTSLHAESRQVGTKKYLLRVHATIAKIEPNPNLPP